MKPSSRRVLLLSHPEDKHADAVQKRLDSLGVQALRLDVPEIVELGFSARYQGGKLTGDLAGTPLSDIGIVYHRRPSKVVGLSTEDISEAHAAVGGLLSTLPHLNHPAKMARAALKLVQLREALRVGLRVPETLVSSRREDLTELSSFDMIMKPIGKVGDHTVREGDLSRLERRVGLMQERIRPMHHVRVVVIDANSWAVQINASELDWRLSQDTNRHTIIPVPWPLERAVSELLIRLGLRHGSLDFVVGHDGIWYFLEVNPNGQWLWLEETTGLPVSSYIASALAFDTHG